MVNQIFMDAFNDELEKISRARSRGYLPLSKAELQKLANLRKYVDAAKAGKYLSAMTSLAGDSKARKEAFQRFQKLKASGNLPPTLQSAPVPEALPKGLRLTTTQVQLVNWLRKNMNKPRFKDDAVRALDEAMTLTL